jgi:predicted AAA+ superfamily ATPase
LYPFSFLEYLSYKGQDIAPLDRMTSSEKSLIKRSFSEYLRVGGFPEYLMTGKDEYLRSLFQNILFRDIIARYRLPLETPIREAALFAAANISKEISFNAVKNLTGLSSATTVKEYFEYMENCYLLFLIPKYDPSLKRQIYYNKKIYFIDPALASLVGFRTSEDHGRILENMVFIALKSAGNEIYFNKGKRECDFLVRKDGHITEAIQVTRDLTRSKSREIEGLMEALEAHSLDQGLILTYDEEGEMEIEGKRIVIKPVWRWLLESHKGIDKF